MRNKPKIANKLRRIKKLNIPASAHPASVSVALAELVQIQELINSVHEKYQQKIRELDARRSAAIHQFIFNGSDSKSFQDLSGLGKAIDSEEIEVTQKYYTVTKELEEAFTMQTRKLLRVIHEHAE